MVIRKHKIFQNSLCCLFKVNCNKDFINFNIFSQVEELISNSQLNIASEEKVFLAVLSWVKHDVAERVQNIGKVSISRVIF